MSGASLPDMAAALVQGRATARALTQDALARIEARNAAWHVFTRLDAAEALAAAEMSDRRRAAGAVVGPLDGIPFAVKDNLDMAGLETTNGARPTGILATRDATVVARLKAEGAVPFGKLNMDEGALGATTDNPVWGRCENPAWPGHTPGGSSGGSAAAVAGGFVPVALGTDTMGSVRIPAAYAGLWGLKPTFGLVPRTGMALLSPSLDAIGPIGADATSVRQVLTAIAGFDTDDPDSVSPPPGWSVDPVSLSLADLSVGVPSAVHAMPCEPGIIEGFRGLVEAVEAAGAAVRPIELADWDPTAVRRAGLLVLEAEASVRLGPAFDAGTSPHGPAFRAMIEFGRRAPGEKLAAAWRRLALVRAGVLRALDHVDLLLLPTAPQGPFAHGAPAPASQADFTALANIAGLPAVSFPHRFGPDRPVGAAQLVGKPFDEARLLSVAEAMAALS